MLDRTGEAAPTPNVARLEAAGHFSAAWLTIPSASASSSPPRLGPIAIESLGGTLVDEDDFDDVDVLDDSLPIAERRGDPASSEG
jgi:hypothetical protein